tara:strand:+ start:114 stop:611 length:498 start_codon:yes stop_codon:yes gene_type:complete
MNATKTGGIFTFDHGQKRLNKSIGVTEEYLNELGEQVSEILKNFIFDENRDLKEDISPSQLVEISAKEFSYSQLVILSSFYLQDKLDGFAKSVENKMRNMQSSVRAIKLDADDLPDNIREMLDNLTEGNSEVNPIDGDSLPPELSDFLKKLAEEQRRRDGDGDDD